MDKKIGQFSVEFMLDDARHSGGSMMKRGIIVIPILLIMAMLLILSVHQKNKRVDKIGQTLANWSSTHQKTMRINGKAISFTGGTIFEMGLEQTTNGSREYCRAYTPVLWQTDEATAEDNRTIRANLKNIIDK